MDHYYSKDPTSKSEERIIDYEINQNKYKFISDNGVFSKNKIDFASEFLIKTIYNEVVGDILDVGCGYGVIGIILSKNKRGFESYSLNVFFTWICRSLRCKLDKSE